MERGCLQTDSLPYCFSPVVLAPPLFHLSVDYFYMATDWDQSIVLFKKTKALVRQYNNYHQSIVLIKHARTPSRQYSNSYINVVNFHVTNPYSNINFFQHHFKTVQFSIVFFPVIYVDNWRNLEIKSPGQKSRTPHQSRSVSCPSSSVASLPGFYSPSLSLPLFYHPSFTPALRLPPSPRAVWLRLAFSIHSPHIFQHLFHN